MTATTIIAGVTQVLSGTVTGTIQGGPPPPPPPGGDIVTVFNYGPGTGNSGGWSGYTIKMVVQPALIVGLTRPALDLRARLFASTIQSFACDKLYVGHRNPAKQAWDAVSLVPLKFGGGFPGTAPAGGFIESDWSGFAWDGTRAIVFSFRGSNAAADDLRERVPLAGAATYYKQGSDQASVADTGAVYGTQAASGVYGILSFDIKQEAAP